MRRAVSMLADLLLAIGVVLLIPFVILLLGVPIVAMVKLIEFLSQRL